MQLLDAKHPTAWVEFERGDITQQELFQKFFKEGHSRPFDGDSLEQFMASHYRFVDGMEHLLQRLQAAGYPMHAMR
jgi:hypothetical protein